MGEMTGDWKQKYRDAGVAGEYDTIRYRGVFKGTMKQALHEHTLRRALRDVPKGGVVLDVPCGTGRFTNFLLREGFSVIGADISPEMLAEARRKVEGTPANLLGFQTCEVERLPFPDKSIDCTLTVRFLHLVPKEVRPAVFRELKRVSRSHVVLCVNVDKYALKNVVRTLRGRGSPMWMSQRELRRELETAGLKVERIHSKLRFLSTLWVVVCRV